MSGGTTSLIHLDTKWISQLHALACLPPWNKSLPPPPGRPYSRCGRCDTQTSPWNRTTICWSCSPANAARYTDSIGQERGKLQLRTTSTRCNDVLHKTQISTSNGRETEDKAGRGEGGGRGGDRKAFCTKVSQAMPALPSGKG
jgi:hypothetical protein